MTRTLRAPSENEIEQLRRTTTYNIVLVRFDDAGSRKPMSSMPYSN